MKYLLGSLLGAGLAFGHAETLAPRIDSVVWMAPGVFQGTLSSQAGSSMVIEVSTNLTDWEALGPVFNGFGGVDFVDASDTNSVQRYYRTRTLPLALPQLPVVDRVTDLRNISGSVGLAAVMARGCLQPGDGGGGWFYWDAEATDAENLGTVLKPTLGDGAGRWRRQEADAINARWFGAVGDGSTDDSASLQQALDLAAARGGGRVFIPPGKYLVLAEGLLVGSNTVLFGADGGTVIKYRFQSAGNAIINRGCGTARGAENITVKELVVDCGGVGGNGVALCSASDCTIQNIKIIDPKGYGVYVTRAPDPVSGELVPSRRVTVANCHLSGVRDVGVELRGAVGCTVIGNTVQGGGNGQAFVAWDGAVDCTFSGNIAEGDTNEHRFTGFSVQGLNPDNPMLLTGRTERITFSANIARRVFVGLSIKGEANSRPSDIMARGNSLNGTFGPGSVGVRVAYSERASVVGNQVSNFLYPLMHSYVGDGSAFDGAKHTTFEQNTIVGGDTSRLYGNVGGSFTGNRFYNMADDAVVLYAWTDCNVAQNLFVNLGDRLDSYGLIVKPYGDYQSVGNTIVGNTAADDRASKLTVGTIWFLDGAPQGNFIHGNSARGCKPGAKAFLDNSAGTDNAASDNRDA